jgi:hypothetical protein
MAKATGWCPSHRTVAVLVTLATCGCSDAAHPRDPRAGTYGAVLWTQEIHGSAPYNQLGVDGASYTVRLESDGRASRRIVVPGGQDGGLYDQALSGTWSPEEPDSVVVVLRLPGFSGNSDTVWTDLPLPFAVRADTLHHEWFGTNQAHEVVILVRQRG